MALRHVSYHLHYPGVSVCGRRGYRSHLTKEQFQAGYLAAHGKEYCSKCAKFMAGRGELTLFDSTITVDEAQLIELLRAGTVVLHDRYIAATREWAKKDYAGMQERSQRTPAQWYAVYQIETEVKWFKDGIGVAAGTSGAQSFVDITAKGYHDPNLNKMRNDRYREGRIVLDGAVKYEAQEVAAAERHYSSSLLKLAVRIKEKALDVAKLTVDTTVSSVRANGIDTVITDGVNRVHAWTILACGEIVRPHYRYLVK